MLVMPGRGNIQEIFRLAMNAVCCHQTLDILHHGYERICVLGIKKYFYKAVSQSSVHVSGKSHPWLIT
jgi:hypothetical protein